MKSVCLAVLILCLGLVRADGDAPAAGGGGSDPLGDAAKMLKNLNPATMCPQITASLCSAQSSLCTSIPNIADCKTNSAQCTASSKSLCDCLTACGPTCDAKADCTGKEGAEKVECEGMHQLCMSTCESQCPVTEINKAAQKSIQGTNAMIQELAKQIQGMLGGGHGGGAEH